MASVDDVVAAGFDLGKGEGPYTSAGNFIQIYAGILVVSMHIGFSMLEAGSVRKGSAVNILFKNLGTLAIGALSYYSIGGGFGSGTLTIFGDGPFFFSGVNFDNTTHGPWFFTFSFVATAATIVSGAVAGRINLVGYFIVAFLITGVIYPPITASIWFTGGWLSAFQSSGANALILTADGLNDPEACGMFDYAGSGVVHMTGGVAAFWGAFFLGPRTGRFENPADFVAHNYALTTMGTIILWFGWYGFNCGSALGWYAGAIGKVAVTTTLAPCFACVTGFTYVRLVRKEWDLGVALNCILAGLVSITAGCSIIPNGLSALAGIIGAFVYLGASKLMVKIGIDDPVDAIAVHGFCGMWGVLAAGLFSDENLIANYYFGCTQGVGAILPYQIIGLLYIFAWVSATTIPIFLILKKLKLLRVTAEEEADLDNSEHGIGAYEKDA